MSRLRDAMIRFGVPRRAGGVLLPTLGNQWYADSVEGNDGRYGNDHTKPLASFEKALERAVTGDVIYLFGDFREEVVIPNTLFDITVVGLGGLHHPDVPGTGYHPGGAMIRPPASPTTATPPITLRSRGWTFRNLILAGPADAAAIFTEANALSGLSEYDPSHLTIESCRFDQGLYGLADSGGLNRLRIYDTEFTRFSGAGACAIQTLNHAVRFPWNWHLEKCRFPAAATVEGNKGNQCHIDAELHSSIIEHSHFGTVEATDPYIDLTDGQDNQIGPLNFFMGEYDNTNYIPATGDQWAGNVITAGITTAAPTNP